MVFSRNRLETFLIGIALIALALTAACNSGSSGIGNIDTDIEVAPRVTDVNPESRSTGALISEIVLALFDQDMRADTITSDTFTLTGPSGKVPGVVSCDSPCRTASFDPDDPLEVETTYTAELDGSIRNAGGYPMWSDVSWSFATAPDMVRASTDANGIEGIDESRSAATDRSGRFVAFDSSADNLVAGDLNAALDVFVKDTQTGNIGRVSVNADGIEGNGNSTRPAISADGRYVAFESAATNLLASATTVAGVQIYRKDRETGEVTLVSADGSGGPGVRIDPSGNVTDGNSINASISADGRYVTFQSNATNLVALPANTAGIHVYLKDLETGTVTLVSATSINNLDVAGDADSTRPAISADGGYVVFQSASLNFGADGGLQTQIFRKNLGTGDLLLVSATDDQPPVRGDGTSTNPTISDDGQLVAFETSAPNLGASSFIQIIRKDTSATTNSLVVASADEVSGSPGDGPSFLPSISGDGRYVAFQSAATSLVGASNSRQQIYVKDLQGGISSGPIELISRDPQPLPAALGDRNSLGAAMTGDGVYVAFDSEATNLIIGDGNGVADVFRGLNSTFSP